MSRFAGRQHSGRGCWMSSEDAIKAYKSVVR